MRLVIFPGCCDEKSPIPPPYSKRTHSIVRELFPGCCDEKSPIPPPCYEFIQGFARFRVQGLGFRFRVQGEQSPLHISCFVQVLGFSQGFGFRVQDLGRAVAIFYLLLLFKVQGLRLRVRVQGVGFSQGLCCRVQFKVQGLGFRVQGLVRVCVLGRAVANAYLLLCLGFRVQLRFWVQSLGFRASSRQCICPACDKKQTVIRNKCTCGPQDQ